MRKLSDHKGFTLIELLISMAILGLVLASLASLFASTNKNYSAQSMVVTMQGNARTAADFVTRTMKGLSATTAINETACASSITFTTDETAFGGVVETHGFWRYNSASDGANTLGYKKGTADIMPLAPNITCFTLTRAGTARIDLVIMAETPTPRPDTGLKGTFTLRSSVDLRN